MNSLILVLALAGFAVPARAQDPPPADRWPVGHALPRPRVFLPEQRSIDVRAAVYIPTAGVPDMVAPPTVAGTHGEIQEVQLALDDAIGIALENSEVIRVLAGVQAASSGRTIYDVGISNTGIDEQQAPFDPTMLWEHSFNRFERPSAFPEPTAPGEALIGGSRRDDYNMHAGVAKKTITGGSLQFGANTNPRRDAPPDRVLRSENPYSLDLKYEQPLFRGGGIRANRAPIVIARIETERSFFQYKNSVQEMVRGVIDAYWALVFARTDRWAREQQVEQATFAWERAQGRFDQGMASRGVAAQARVSLGNFRTSLVAAENNVLQREAALRNILGLPPSDGKRLVPVTPPNTNKIDFDWPGLLALAEQNRPDLIELKLVIQADEQQVLLARNAANPNVDASMLYRWNGLEGTTPNGAHLSTHGGQHTDWSMGVNFSVPLTLRGARAALRRQDLIVARDRANLRQGLHSTSHILATNLRSLEQFHAQYKELNAIRDDARLNLQERRARWDAGGVGGVSFVDFLLAVNDFGNTISSEARALTQYNTELANIELATGTILESHGIRFFEERFGAVGPLGRLAHERCYPSSMPPTPNAARYPRTDEPAENFFELDDPELDRRRSEELPPPSN